MQNTSAGLLHVNCCEKGRFSVKRYAVVTVQEQFPRLQTMQFREIAVLLIALSFLFFLIINLRQRLVICMRRSSLGINLTIALFSPFIIIFNSLKFK